MGQNMGQIRAGRLDGKLKIEFLARDLASEIRRSAFNAAMLPPCGARIRDLDAARRTVVIA